jgi:Family of unknown function (DUF6272)
MNIEDVAKFYKVINKEGIILSYQGPFLQEMIEEISTIMNKKLSDVLKLKINSKYLSIFIEQAQNVLRYSSDINIDEKGSQISSGIILTGMNNGNVFIISGNPIDRKHEIFLKEKLEQLDKCSKEELKELFKEQLRDDNDNELSKGAGLGLIDIYRKSDKLEYHFSKMESGEVFFSIKTEYRA